MSLNKKLVVATSALTAVGTTLGLRSCVFDGSIIEYSAVMEQKTRVSTHYTPSWVQMMTIPIDEDTITIVPIIHPEIKSVSFKGSVSFSMGNGRLYDLFANENCAIVRYNEVYKVKKRDINGDGELDEVSRKFVGNQFIDAVPCR